MSCLSYDRGWILKGVFITGTDTGVGKTVVSAVLIRALISRGIYAGAMKPLETGCRRAGTGELMPADGMFLKETAAMDDSIDLVAPVCFEQPLAPMVASEIENKPVGLDSIRRAYKALSDKYDFMVVEGAGGLLVPIMREPSPFFMIDLIKDLGLPVIVVARRTLGTINHTLLTVNYALREGLEVAGVIINQSTPHDNTVSSETNPAALAALCPVPILGMVPHMDIVTPGHIEDISSVVSDWFKSF